MRQMRDKEHTFSRGCSNDLILIIGEKESKIACSDVVCWLGGTIGHQNVHEMGLFLSLLVVPRRGTYLRFAVRHEKIHELLTREGKDPCFLEDTHCRDSLELLADSLVAGRNPARLLLTDKHHRLVSIVPTNIFVWDYRDKVCIVDVDGTITSSTVPAFLTTVYLQHYKVCHREVCRFLSQLVEKAPCRLQILYLTARPISMADSTRKFLVEVRQDGHGLPEGPLIGFTGTLAGVLKMEIDTATAILYKYNSLKSCLLNPFNDIGLKAPACYLWGGVGNSRADEHAYLMAGVSPCRIFIIDQWSNIRHSKEQCTCAPRRTGACEGAVQVYAGYEDAALLHYLHTSWK